MSKEHSYLNSIKLLAVSLEILDDMDASNKPPAAPPLPLPPSTAGLVRSSDGRGMGFDKPK